jgi:hypothetical protein
MKLTNVILLLTFIAPPAFAQPPDPGIPILRGVVTTANDVPLARVRVGVAGAPASERGVLTNNRGEFAIRLPDSGSSRLSFTEAGYAGHTAAITRAQLTEPRDVRVRLLRGGAISGHASMNRVHR